MPGSAQSIQLKVDDGGTIKAAMKAVRGIADAILPALTKGAKEGATLLEHRIMAATATWDHPPKMTTTPGGAGIGGFSGTSASYVLTIGAPSATNPYPWVDQGTKGPYAIVAKNAPFLVFRTGYTPKTDPQSLAAGIGGATGPTVHAIMVMHPGIKPRNITDQALEETRKEAEDNMQSQVLDVIDSAWNR